MTVGINKKGQNLTEAAVIIGIVALAFIGMQAYVKRGLQGKFKGLTDNMIGTEQSAYQQDASGLEINQSNSALISNSAIASDGSLGGARDIATNEATIINYSSQSADSY